jgi:hypothetical protein
MSRIKEYYHEEICEGIRKMQEASVDEEYQYELFKKEEENKKLEKQAEEAEFFSIFEKTGTYPI